MRQSFRQPPLFGAAILFYAAILFCAAILAMVISVNVRWPDQLTSVIVNGGGSGSTYHIVLRGSHGTDGTTGGQIGPVFIPSLITHTGASLAMSCVSYRTVEPSSKTLYQAELSWAQAMWARLSVYPRCDANPVGTLNIEVIWEQVVNDRLPTPKISAHPQLGVINVPMELITSTTTGVTTTVSTNDGPLTIRAWSWSSWQFSSNSPKGTPPPGSNRVTWCRPTRAGLVDAGLSEHWSGYYSVGGLSGTLPTLTVSSNLIQYPVIALTTLLHNVL
ncbi:hypothetical protein [Ferrimicrobium acidiphilum]|uniref:hypothetical protein n=1 Tax=Ferrimicrobium acidiphilum TaxID=121039 RepID=UPI0023F2A859|nr:hypothetical protein [Ferrimicrobium acidiphilum]